MLHKIGKEYAVKAKHHPNENRDDELIKYYVTLINLFYADAEAQKWVASKLREDIPMVQKFAGISRTQAILWWCRTQYKLIKNIYNDKYEVISTWEEDDRVVEEYISWLEEKHR